MDERDIALAWAEALYVDVKRDMTGLTYGASYPIVWDMDEALLLARDHDHPVRVWVRSEDQFGCAILDASKVFPSGCYRFNRVTE